MKYIIKNKWLYYLLQFTWGLLMNIIGGLLFAALIIFGKKRPKKFCNCWYIVVGKRWGGLSMGNFMFVSEASRIHTKYHEAGHSLQNIVWGPLWIFVIGIPSALRYWYRKLTPNKKHPHYDSIWFEGQASEWGYRYYQHDIEDKIGELFYGQ